MRRTRDAVSSCKTPSRETIPSFEFDLTVHALEDWVKLTAPAMRSAVEHCPYGRTFVYVSWQYVQMPGEDTNYGHSTLFYFDTRKRIQVFFDESTACRYYSPGSFNYFAKNHFWDPGARCIVVDAHICRTGVPNLGGYFEPPKNTIDGGSCASVNLLLLLCSLRFQCDDLQAMVNAIRASMKLRNYKKQMQVLVVSCLYKWHASLNPRFMGLWKQRGTLLEACHIRIPPGASGPSACGAWLGDAKCCPEQPLEGWALCDKHLSGLLRDPVGSAETQARLNDWWRHVPAAATYEFPFCLRLDFVESDTGFAAKEPRIGALLYRHRCETKITADQLVLPPLQHKEMYHIVRLDGYLDGDGDHREELAALLHQVPWQKIREHSGHMLLQIYHRASVAMTVLVDIVRRSVPVEGWERLVVIATHLTICMQSGQLSSDDRLVLVVADGTKDPSTLITFLKDTPNVPDSLQIISNDLSQLLVLFLKRRDGDANRQQKGLQLVLSQEPAAADVAEILTALGHRTGKLPGVNDRTGLDIVVAPDEPGVRYTLQASGANVSGSRSFVEQVVKLSSERWDPRRETTTGPAKRKAQTFWETTKRQNTKNEQL